MALIIPEAPLSNQDFRPVMAPKATPNQIPKNLLNGLSANIDKINQSIYLEKLEQDKTEANDAYNTAQHAVNETLYGEKGLFSLSGQNFIDKSDMAFAEAENIGASLFKELSPDQQKIFEPHYDSMMVNLQRTIFRKRTNEVKVAASTSKASTITDAIYRSGKDYSDNNLQLNESTIRSYTVSRGEGDGLPTESIVENLKINIGKMYYEAVLGAISVNDFESAKNIKDANQEKMSSTQMIALNKRFKTASASDIKDKIERSAYDAVNRTATPDVPLDSIIKDATNYLEITTGMKLTPDQNKAIVKESRARYKINGEILEDNHRREFSDLATRLSDGDIDFNTLSASDLDGYTTGEKESLSKINNSGNQNSDLANYVALMPIKERADLKINDLVGVYTNVNSPGINDAIKQVVNAGKGVSNSMSDALTKGDSIFKEIPLVLYQEDPSDIKDKSWYPWNDDEYKQGLRVSELIEDDSKGTLAVVKTRIKLVALRIVAERIKEKLDNGEDPTLTDQEYRDIYTKASYTDEYNTGIKDIPLTYIGGIEEIIEIEEENKRKDFASRGITYIKMKPYSDAYIDSVIHTYHVTKSREN